MRGAVVAAMAMLVIEDVTSVLVSPVWASFAFFVLLVSVLVFRPQGLYGVRVRERI
jgi:branched-chain amino acid transport system permease protein